MSERTVEQHKPDRSRIAKALQSLDWQPLPQGDDVLWEDGSRLLSAVPICVDANKPNGEWYYECDLVTIRCDEGYFAIEANGVPWGWSLSDIDYLVVLNGGPCRDTENGPVRIEVQMTSRTVEQMCRDLLRSGFESGVIDIRPNLAGKTHPSQLSSDDISVMVSELSKILEATQASKSIDKRLNAQLSQLRKD